jgi:hypothetical protein
MQSRGNTIFVGIKINDRLRDQLDSSNASMKPFFASNNPEYLQVMRVDSEDYIGKVTESGTSIEALGNMARNVKSMLQMICPKFALTEDAIKILGLSANPSSSIGRSY